MVRLLTALATVLLVAVLAGCGRDDEADEQKIIGDTLTIYSSLPLRGPLAGVSNDIVLAEKLALKEAGGRAGRFQISFVSLDSADPDTGTWSPGRVASNARDAVKDLQTIAYLGELESGASAVSVPILNSGGMLQVSPRDTFAGLTARGPRGEPERYYPSGERTFTRVVAGDDEQVRGLARLMARRGVRRVVLADDRRVAGTSLVDRLAVELRREGIRVADRERLDPGDDVPDDFAAELREDRADAFLYGGEYSDFAVDLLKAVHAGAPGVELYAPDNLAIAPQLPSRAGAAGRDLILTGVDVRESSGARAFERRFQAEFGTVPDRQAILGYEAMRLVLRAIARAGDDASSRRRVVREALRLGAEAPVGFASYRIARGRLVRVGPAL